MISQFTRREKFKQGLSPLYLPYYEQLCELLPDHWQPYQGYRSIEQQDKLYAAGRTAPGHIVTNARGGQSAHNYGCATDWTIWDVNDKPIWMERSDPAWNEFVEAVLKVGLRSGKEFGDIDHCEIMISCSWPAIFSVFSLGGMDAASSKIKEMLVA